MNDTIVRDSLVRSICARLSDDRRTEDDIRIIDDVLAGIEVGADRIGPMNLTDDKRDFDEEAAQECRDLIVYLAMKRVAAQHKRREQLRFDAAAELAHLTAEAEGNKHTGQLPAVRSTFDLRESSGELLEVHEILPAFGEEEVTRERVVHLPAFDTSDVDAEVA